MRRRLVFLLVALVAVSAIFVPAVFSQMQGEQQLNLPLLPNGPMPDQQPTSQPPPTETAPPTEPPMELTPTATAPTPTACVPLQPPENYYLDDLSISLERTACFGACPEYTVTIRGDGLVVYEGRRNVRVVGREEDQIDRDNVVALLQAFYDDWFFDLRPEYLLNRMVEVEPDGTVRLREGMVSDLPSQIVTFKVGTYEKRVVDYYNPPPGLRDLEANIDETAGTAKWVTRAP